MILPNFLVIGAAKSGTSSLYQYLVQHPQVYGSRKKEPSFFAFEGETVRFQGPGDEVYNNSVVTQLEDYTALFRGVSHEIAVGEASVVYLYSEKAPARIRHYIPGTKLIAILRNPVDRAISSYSHLLRDQREPNRDFSKALEAEEKRIAANWQHLWHYTRMGFYFNQLKRYFDLFPSKQIAVFTYDEFSSNPLETLQAIFRFLNVDTGFLPDTSYRHNVSGTPRSRLLHDFLVHPSLLKSGMKLLVPSSIRMQLQLALMRRNIKQGELEIPYATVDYLRELYRDDIVQLQRFIGKDLSGWLR